MVESVFYQLDMDGKIAWYRCQLCEVYVFNLILLREVHVLYSEHTLLLYNFQGYRVRFCMLLDIVAVSLGLISSYVDKSTYLF